MNDKKFILTIIILICATSILYGIRYFRGEVVLVEKKFYTLPHTIGEWHGVDKEFDESIYNELRADENLYRIYTHTNGNTLGLYIGYYGTKRGGHPDHVPTGCYPGSGWGIDSVTPLDVSSQDGAKTITVNNLYATKGDKAEQTLYWLQNFLGTVTYRGIEQNLEKMRTKLFYNRNDGAFIRINSPVENTRTETMQFQKEFIAELIPLLPDCWPREE